MASGPTQADACRKVGKNIQTFLYWICWAKELFELRNLIEAVQREEMSLIHIAQEVIIEIHS